MALFNLIGGIIMMGIFMPGVALARKNYHCHLLWVAEHHGIAKSEICKVPPHFHLCSPERFATMKERHSLPRY
jgi:hypothetical protein